MIAAQVYGQQCYGFSAIVFTIEMYYLQRFSCNSNLGKQVATALQHAKHSYMPLAAMLHSTSSLVGECSPGSLASL